MKIIYVLVTPFIIVGVALIMWIGFPRRIMQRWSRNMDEGEHSAFWLYYAAMILAGLGIWKLCELIH